MRAFARFLTTYSKSLIAVLVLLSIVAIYPASNIRTDFNLEGFFPKNDSTLIQYTNVSEIFGRDDNTIIIAFEHDSIFSERVLKGIKILSDSLSSIPHIESVQSVWDASNLSSSNGQINAETYLSEPLSDLNTVQNQMLKDTLVSGVYLNGDATVTAIYLNLFEDQNNYPNRAVVIDNMNRHLAQAEFIKDPHLSGIPFFRNGYVNELNGEIIYYIALGSVLIILLLWFLFRNVRDVLLPLLIVWITILFTVALIQLSGGYFEIMSSTIAPILLCVGIADSVHMLSKYNDGLMNGLHRSESILDMLRKMGSATFLTSITTAIGFATLSVSNIIPMKNFGIYTAVGVLLAYVVTMLFLTPFIHQFKQTDKQRAFTLRFYKQTSGYLSYVNRFIRNRYKSITIVGFIIAFIFIGGLPMLQVNSRIYDDLGDETKLMRDNTFISNELTPQFPIDVVFDQQQPEGIFDATLINKIDELESFLISFPEIEKVLSYRDILERVHRALQPDSSTHYEAMSNKQVAQYTLLLELAGSDGLERFVDFEYRRFKVTALTKDVGSKRINEIRTDLNEYLNTHFSDYNYLLSGTNILVADLTNNIVFSLNSSIMLAVLFIAIILGIMFRDVRLVLISLLPNLFPLIVTAGFMGYFGVDIKPSTAVIFTISFGIVVDDTIHYLSRLRLELREQEHPIKAITITTNRTGRAIILTSMILLTGFGVLGTSTFDSTQAMGALTCLTIFGAVFYDLLFLPAMLTWYYSKGKSEVLRERNN